jgi:hypothetical protein
MSDALTFELRLQCVGSQKKHAGLQISVSMLNVTDICLYVKYSSTL